jgi:hypothetical protein
MEDFLLGLVADGAGVVEDEVGHSRPFSRLAVALGNERADDLFESWTFIWHPKVSR